MPGIEISATNLSPDFSCQCEYRPLQESLHPVLNFTKLMLFIGCFESSYLTANTELWGSMLWLWPKMVLPKPLLNMAWRMCGESLVKIGTKTDLLTSSSVLWLYLWITPPCTKSNGKHYLKQLFNTYYSNISQLTGARNKTPFNTAYTGDSKLLELH